MRANKNDFSGTDAFYLSWVWRVLRDKIKQRDNYQCKYCHSKTGLIVHHKIPREKWGNPKCYHNEADSDSNLETVCPTCHWSLHNFLRYNIA
jgi:5-methylcytosine-specific restriction protein A